MNSIKQSLTNKLNTLASTWSLTDPTSPILASATLPITIIDPWRLPEYQYSSFFKGVLVSIKIDPSKYSRLNYGMQIVNNDVGNYVIYKFTLFVLSRYDFVEEITDLESQTAYQAAEAIIKYLRMNNKDPQYGVLDIYEITARESDPSGGAGKGAHMSRIIIEGFILAERPLNWSV
jgi:hypothetical protein